jgi:amidophosphoribosyltransferase
VKSFADCWTSDKLGEECGVFGISLSPSDSYSVADETYLALFALQHRGQESSGIATSNDGKIHVIKKSGLVPEVFNEHTLQSLHGNMAIGHVRYSSHAEASAINAQPVVVTHINGSMAIACNGTLVNGARLRHDAELSGAIFQTTNDTEVIAYMLVRERLGTPLMEQAVKNIMNYVAGAYSMVIISGNKLIAARDPFGFKPLCMGMLGSSVVFASESCAFDAIGAQFVRDIEPGEIVVAENGDVTATIYSEKRPKSSLCVFEFIYFARPDSIIDGLSVEHVRQEFGKYLAMRDNVKADIVIGVPDSGLSAALGYSKQSGIPYGIGLVKNRYIGRTFIQNSRSEREKSVSIKLNALASAVKGKRVIMVDDSIVRGTTCAHLVSILRQAGASEVHMRVSSPPFLHRCYYGTDIPSEKDLAAYNRTVEQISEMICADTLMYLDPKDLHEAMAGLRVGYCDSCFTGNYPVPISSDLENQKEGRIQV